MAQTNRTMLGFSPTSASVASALPTARAALVPWDPRGGRSSFTTTVSVWIVVGTAVSQNSSVMVGSKMTPNLGVNLVPECTLLNDCLVSHPGDP